MSVFQKTIIAATVAAGTILSAPAMAHAADQQPGQQSTPQNTLTPDEAGSIKKLFMLEACVDSSLASRMAVIANLMVNNITLEQAEARIAAETQKCETSAGITEAEADAVAETLNAKYGEEEVNTVISNSYYLIYDDLSAEEKAVIKLVGDFGACAQAESDSFKSILSKWQESFDAALKAGKTEEEIIADLGQQPADPDIRAICTQKVGVTDAEAFKDQIKAITGKYGTDVLEPPAPQN